MIATAFLNLIYTFVLGIVALLENLGTVSSNNALTSSIVQYKEYYMALDAIVPIGTLLSIVAFVLTFEGIYLLYKAIRWGYKKIPAIS